MAKNIKVNETYTTRNGGVAVIVEIKPEAKYPVRAKVNGGLLHMYDYNGFTVPGMECDVDLITKK